MSQDAPVSYIFFWSIQGQLADLCEENNTQQAVDVGWYFPIVSTGSCFNNSEGFAFARKILLSGHCAKLVFAAAYFLNAICKKYSMKTKSLIMAAFLTGIMCNESFAQVDTSGKRKNNRDTASRSEKRDTSQDDRNRRDTAWNRNRRDTLNQLQNKVSVIKEGNNTGTAGLFRLYPATWLMTSRELLLNRRNPTIVGDGSTV
jgi:hypothetical protein